MTLTWDGRATRIAGCNPLVRLVFRGPTPNAQSKFYAASSGDEHDGLAGGGPRSDISKTETAAPLEPFVRWRRWQVLAKTESATHVGIPLAVPSSEANGERED